MDILAPALLRFRSMRVLTYVQPTPEQLPILTDSGPGFRLIRGAAGSGKTTAALMRLRQLCRARQMRKRRLGETDPIQVLVLTFNRTLSGYVEHLAMEQVGGSSEVSLVVETFSRWAMGLCESSKDIVDDASLRQLLIATGFSQHLEYFVDEVHYVLGRWHPSDRQGYLGAERFGRGRAPAVPQSARARLLKDVITPHGNQIAALGKVQWNDLALEAATAPSRQYDVVVVDGGARSVRQPNPGSGRASR